MEQTLTNAHLFPCRKTWFRMAQSVRFMTENHGLQRLTLQMAVCPNRAARNMPPILVLEQSQGPKPAHAQTNPDPEIQKVSIQPPAFRPLSKARFCWEARPDPAKIRVPALAFGFSLPSSPFRQVGRGGGRGGCWWSFGRAGECWRLCISRQATRLGLASWEEREATCWWFGSDSVVPVWFVCVDSLFNVASGLVRFLDPTCFVQIILAITKRFDHSESEGGR